MLSKSAGDTAVPSVRMTSTEEATGVPVITRSRTTAAASSATVAFKEAAANSTTPGIVVSWMVTVDVAFGPSTAFVPAGNDSTTVKDSAPSINASCRIGIARSTVVAPAGIVIA